MHRLHLVHNVKVLRLFRIQGIVHQRLNISLGKQLAFSVIAFMAHLLFSFSSSTAGEAASVIS